MPRYEFVKGSSSKFWEIELSGNSYTTIYGKIGTDGKSTTKDFKDAETAKKKYEAIIKSKVKKGYALVGDVAPDVESSEASFAPENKELEQAIFNDRDDAQAWQVFGDWLQGEGDPRGEAIALSFNNDGGKLKKLIATYEQSWLGDLYESYEKCKGHDDKYFKPETVIDWKHGFMEHARIAADHEDTRGETKLKALLALPAARFLHSLTIGLYVADSSNGYSGIAERLKGKLPMLRHLFVGDFVYPDETEMSWSEMEPIDGFLNAFPHLHSLRVRSGNMSVKGSLDHAELRSLIIESGGVGAAITKKVGSAKLPKLENLELWTGQEDYGGYGPLSDYAPLLAGETCPNLKHLRFKNAEQADDFVNVLAESALLPQLETVDLSMGMFTPRGARRLIEHKAKYAHLTSLDVSECCLGEDVIKDLKKHFGAKVINAVEQNAEISYAEWDEAVNDAEDEDELNDMLLDMDCYTQVGE